MTPDKAAADRVRGRFVGHDDDWIIVTLWKRLAEARRDAGMLRDALATQESNDGE